VRAISVENFGDVPRLNDLPVPEPGRGEIQVTIEAAAVNPLDRSIASGALAAVGEYRFPLTLGMDGAGVVSAVGEGVGGFRAGDRVFGQFWSLPLQFGTFADVAVVQAVPALGALAAVPEGLTSQVAAALPTSGMTALGALDHLRVPDRGTLLVLGATGGVGSFAVQLAAAQGVRVIATAAAHTADQVRELGAANVIVRDKEPLEDALARLVPEGVDAVLDAVGDRGLTSRVSGAVRDGGALLSIAFGIADDLAADERVRGANYLLDRKPERLAELAGLAAAGRVRPVVGAELPLEDAPRVLAGETTVKGLRGKTVLHVS
jgi:NADPH:quinone reductase-like Zn-dependent oxidoreductase